MKKVFIVFIIIVILGIVGILFFKMLNDEDLDIMEFEKEDGYMEIITLKVNDNIFEIQLEDNSSAFAFRNKLKENDIIIKAQDYGNFEKVGDLGFSLPTNDTRITTKSGDLILYQGNKIALYYDINTYSFTKLGKILNVSELELKDILGNDDVELTFSIKAKEIKAQEFNFNTKKVMLNSGYEMPINGLGTYSLTGDVCKMAVKEALSSGVRLIDTAYIYGNEVEIGEAIKESGIRREEIFVTTKLYPNQYDNPVSAIEMAFEKLDLEYIDLMLLHHPGDNDVQTYKVLEEYVRNGKIHSIGLSNWYVEELKEFLPKISIMPAIVQNEIHPFYQENDVIPYIQNLGIVVEGWYPFGGRGYTKELLNNEIILSIASNYNVSAAQVILRWNLQKGIVVIPGSSNPKHIKENNEIYHFSLSNEEMDRINALDKNEKHDWY